MYSDVTFSAVSPADSSLWIATAERGLIRVGRNGKAFTYSSAKGDFDCDAVETLAFDDDGTLWMRDANGAFWSYTSFSGFVKHESVPTAVSSLLVTGEAVESVQVPAESAISPAKSYTWYGGWWMILVTGLLLFALLLKFLKRNPEKPVVFETKATQETEPAQEIKPHISAKTVSAKPAPAAPVVADTSVGVAGSAFHDKVLGIIASNFTNPDFGVESITEMLGISRVHLNRKLKEENAPSPSVMIKKMRMDKAVVMLKEGNTNISEIARQCGFSSATYFSNAFKEYFNIAPTQYK